MKLQRYITLLILFAVISIQAQHNVTINSVLDTEKNTLNITQKIQFKNTSSVSLNEIYLNDWANSFSSKTTPLGKRFSENYSSSFHFEKDEDRGKTTILNISNNDQSNLSWNHGDAVDIIIVTLNQPLLPNETFDINLMYTVQLPNDKFTRYGVTENKDYKLNYWFITPAVFDGEWHAFSNKNTEDLYLSPSSFNISITTPKKYFVISDFDIVSETISEENKETILEGDQRMFTKIHLIQRNDFETIKTDKFDVITNLKGKKVTPTISALSIDRIVHFLDEKLGAYPFEKILITKTAYKKNPVYGLNQLPNFISPFPDGFEYNMEQLKTISRAYI
ncbi:MAG: metalloprotease, partial [Flavobacteriaceae bacterium]|nr:metalloprotease [Flavobacteriaceae bacterium]